MTCVTTINHAEHDSTVVARHLAADTVGIDDEILLKMSEAITDFAEVTQNAHAATDFERHMTFREVLKLYPKAITFSVILSLAIVMAGYDTAVLASFYGYPVFNQRFGVKLADGTYQVTSQWQSGL